MIRSFASCALNISIPPSDESSAKQVHSFDLGGKAMKVIHTHPAIPDDERLERLKDIKKICAKQIKPKAPEKRAG